MILLLAALPAGLLATGCTPDTRELLLDPRLPTAESYPGGSWTTSPVLTCGRSTSALAAWNRDDVLVVGSAGLAVRVQGGQARNIDLPTTSSLIAAVAAPDGPAWVAAYEGTVYRLDGEAWSVEQRSPIRLRALWRRSDGVIFGVGDGGLGLWRTLDGVWEEFDTGAGMRLRGLWGRDNGECWAVGDDGVVARFDGATWSVERPFGAGRILRCVTGDADGRVVVIDGDRVRLREAGEWRELPELPNTPWIADAAFLSGQLLAWNYHGWYRWDGAAWIEEGELGVSPDCHAVVGEDLVMLDSGGTLLRLAGGDAEVLLPEFGSIVDFETTPDGAVILTSLGWIMRETSTGWRAEVRLDESRSNPIAGRRLLRSASGDLVALARGRLYRELEGAWEPLTQTQAPWIGAVIPLGNGALLLWDQSGFWTWTGDRCVFLCDAPGVWGDLWSVAGESVFDARYLFTDLLARYDGVTLQPVADRKRLEVRLLGFDPVEGLLQAGRAGLFAGNGATPLDITPRSADGGTLDRAEIVDFTVTPAGDWLAWTAEGRLLRRRAGLWQSLEGANGSPLWNRVPAAPGRSIRAVGVGDAWLIGYSHLYRYRDSAP